MKLISAKLTGSPGGGKWSQIVEYEPEGESSRGHFFALASCVSENAESGSEGAFGRQVLSQLQEEYFAGEGSAFEDLKTSVEHATHSTSGIKLETLAISVTNDIVYFAGFGGASISIYRDGVYKNILNSSEENVSGGSGRVKNGDILMLSTSSFFDGYEANQIASALEQKNPEDIAETLAVHIHSAEGQGDKALVVIGVSDGASAPVQEQNTPVAEPVVYQHEVTEDSATLPTRRPSIFKGRFGRGFYVKRAVGVEDTKRRKNAVSVGAILLVLLLVSIGFGGREVARERAQKEFDSKVAEARHNLDEAKALFALNPVQARELFNQSEEIINDLEKNYAQEKEVADLVSYLEDGRRRVLGEFDTQLDEFVDLSLIDGFSGAFMAATADTLYVYDGAKDRVVEVVVGTKKTQVRAGPSQINSAEALAAYSGRIFILENDGVYEVGSARTKLFDKDWDGDALIAAYTGNMYVLDKSGSNIFRHSGLSEGGAVSSWLAPGISIDLSRVSSWTIDGSIWILTSTGKIEKYSQGVPQNLELAKVDPVLSNPTAIYTNEELENIYVLDPSTSRVVVFGKDGSYKAQYKSSTLGEAVGLFASEKDGKIIVLTKEKLYSISIAKQ